MSINMEWADLIKPWRLGCPPPKSVDDKPMVRSEFMRDWDRIVFSSAFRRLQGKTQVFPLPESDMTHTRLTHSLEASCVGRSLGRMVGERLENKGADPDGLGSIVAAACLAHDLGNPPFGHSGEDAISYFFREGDGKVYIELLRDPAQQNDLKEFEGNASGFRVMTDHKLTQTDNPGGLSLTLPTLAAYTKYPRQSYVEKPDTSRKSEQKFGIFFDGVDSYREIARGLEIPEKPQDRGWYRHPLAFLAEAADDICYLVMDFEDGYRLGLVSYMETLGLLTAICEQQQKEGYLDGLKRIRADDQKIGYLRAKCINSLVYQVADMFEEKDQQIRAGVFDRPLLELVPSKKELDDIRRRSVDEIYSHRPVAQIECAGFDVLGGLLGVFLEATVLKPESKKSEKVRSLVPTQFLDEKREPFSNKYQTIMNITEYISCMTDTFAIDTYRILTGISLPNYSP
jgi:dGTPase